MLIIISWRDGQTAGTLFPAASLGKQTEFLEVVG